MQNPVNQPSRTLISNLSTAQNRTSTPGRARSPIRRGGPVEEVCFRACYKPKTKPKRNPNMNAIQLLENLADNGKYAAARTAADEIIKVYQTCLAACVNNPEDLVELKQIFSAALTAPL